MLSVEGDCNDHNRETALLTLLAFPPYFVPIALELVFIDKTEGK
jgi:hypothetical protein